MSKNGQISRRQFLKISASSAAGLTLANVLPVSAGFPHQGMTYTEAPELAELVASGQLPPVAERLPLNPVVIEPLDSIGVYGGSLRSRIINNQAFQVRTLWGPEGILRIGWDNSTVEPNIAESWEYSDDGTEITLRLREGMKWSDGAPFNANNFEFWFNHVILNTTLTPSIPQDLRINGEPAEFEKVDDYTVRFKFVAPAALFPIRLAHAFGVTMVPFMARHYLEQFHPDFVDEAELTAKAADAGFETWNQYFSNRVANNYGMPLNNPDLPTLLPFKLSRPLELNLMVVDRNPYYWKVDPEGKQLPYVNEVIVTNVESPEVGDAMIAAGELNYVNTDTNFGNFPLYQGNAEGNNYEVRLWQTSRGTEHTLMLNQTAKDPVLREIFRDIRFRQALSLAMDRQTIANVVYQGFGVPSQVYVIQASKYFEEGAGNVFTDYDPDQANALLDEMGLTERDGQGIRLRPDGEPLVLRLDFQVGTTQNNEVSQLWAEFFREVGVQVDLRPIARDLIRTLIDNNDIEVGIWQADKCSDVLFQTLPIWFVPYTILDWNQWGIEWARWYETGGEAGEEPPAEVKQVQDLYTRLQSTIDEEENLQIGREILQLNLDNLWNIGDVGQVPFPVIIGSNLINVPQEGYTGFDWLGNHQYHIEQVYFEGGRWTGEQA